MQRDLYKRHKTRYRGITYREKADGRRTYYVFGGGRQHSAGATERHALALQTEFRQRMAKGQALVRTALFKDLAEEWLVSKAKLRRWTRDQYRGALDNELIPAFGKLAVSEITADRVALLIRKLEERGLTGSYILNLLKPLSGTLALAVRRGMIAQSPMTLLTPDERPKARRKDFRQWSPNDVDRLLVAAAKRARQRTSRYDYTLFLQVAIYSGLRLGELLGLQWRDVDLSEGVIHVRRQWTRTRELAEPKTPKAIRRVPIGQALMKALRAHKMASPYSRPGHFVFSSLKVGPLAHRNLVRRGFEAAVKEAKLNEDGEPRITFHDLRHAFASLMIERGISSTVLADVMGHESAATTERCYVHLFNRIRTDNLVREAMESAMHL